MAETGMRVDDLLRAHGAVELADRLGDCGSLAADFDRQRDALSRAVASATAAGARDELLRAIRARLDAGDDQGRALEALLRGDPDRLPTPPRPSPSQASPAGDIPYAARIETPAPVSAVTTVPGDELVWSVVALAVLGVVVVLTASVTTVLALAPVLFVGQLVLLGLDLHALRRADVRAPGWGWVLFAPGYCFRRGRALGRAAHYGHAIVAVGVIGRVAIAYFGVGGGPMIDTGRLEDALNANVERSGEVASSTDCPRFVEVVPGDRFDCTASMVDGARYSVTYEIQDERGALREVGTSYSGAPAG